MENFNSKPMIVANWKMNKSISEAESWINDFSSLNNKNKKIIIAAPYILTSTIISKKSSLPISVAAQDCTHLHPSNGAFTGDISAKMLRDLGCEYVILGHSERRKFHSESNHQISQKIRFALESGLKIILCVGESLEIRESGSYLDFVTNQLNESLGNIKDFQNITVAYEPVWAIGTRINASEEQIEEMHNYIKDYCYKLCKDDTQSFDKNPKIIYGGSVTEENAQSILKCSNVSGLLVGGASLDAERFYRIVQHI